MAEHTAWRLVVSAPGTKRRGYDAGGPWSRTGCELQTLSLLTLPLASLQITTRGSPWGNTMCAARARLGLSVDGRNARDLGHAA